MSIILAVRSSRAAVVAADSQRVSSSGVSEAPYEKTFQVGSLIGACAGLLEFSGLDVKSHISRALDGKHLRPRDAAHAIEAYLSPILEATADDEVGFQHRCLDVIVASRDPRIASVRLFPNLALRRIEAEYAENDFLLTAGTEQAKSEVIRSLRRPARRQDYGSEELRALARRAIESAIPLGGPHRLHPDVPSCRGPVRL